MNLYGLGLSALNVAQNNLNTTGHNIANSQVEGYNRQTVLTQNNGARATGAGYIGRGVQAITVQRSYDAFLHNQLVQSQSRGAALVSYGNEISQLNNLFSDPEAGINPAIQKFFQSVNAVASSPADPAARQEMIGRADSLATQIKEANRFIDNQRQDINTQLTTTVSQVNSYVERIHDMNQQIVKARASGVGNHEPNDLLDQRDQLVSELNQLVDVKVLEQDGNFNLTLGSGQILLSGPTVYPLHAVPSANDPSRTVIAVTSSFSNGVPNKAELSDTSFKGGQLGGLLQYRADTLDQAQNALGRLAIGIAAEFNAVHGKGFDLNGEPGGDFFSFQLDKPMGNSTNTGTEVLSLKLNDASKLTGDDYELRFTNNAYEIRTLPNGQFEAADPSKLGFDIVGGVGTPAEGDTWKLSPTRNAADSFKVEMTDPGKIAAAGAQRDENGDIEQDADGNDIIYGPANGDIALELAELQNKKILGNGTMNFNEGYSQLVNRVAVNAQQNGTAAKAQLNLIQQNYAAQQSVSGVNIDEEKVMLDRYQDQYIAAARMIDVASSIFDTILGLRA